MRNASLIMPNAGRILIHMTVFLKAALCLNRQEFSSAIVIREVRPHPISTSCLQVLCLTCFPNYSPISANPKSLEVISAGRMNMIHPTYSPLLNHLTVIGRRHHFDLQSHHND